MAEVAAIISERLHRDGMSVCVVGGSAVTAHAPNIYTSRDIDFAILSGIQSRKIRDALADLGYRKEGRIFVHAFSPWTIDIVAETPFIASRAITDFTTIDTAYGDVLTFRVEDAVADRVAHFIYWSDSEALDVAERLARDKAETIPWSLIERSVHALETPDPMSEERLRFALKRLSNAYSG